MQRKNKTMHDYEAWLGSDLARYMEEPADAPRQISRAQGEQVRIFNLAKIPITMKDNTIATLFIVMDISQTVAYERVKLASKMAEKVAHDIKNPLMPIKLYMQHLVKLQASDSAKFSVRFPETSRRILQQIAVIEGILKRYIAQRTALANRESYVTTQALFDKLQDSLAFLPEGIALRISLHAADATATIDETEFIATVHNLVKNALEAMGQQGEISITQHKAGACMQVTVSDTGSGMSEDTLNRLQQKGGSSKDLGFGIGLTLVKDFVERYHGRMDIQSRPGRGTAVTLTLKVYTP